MKYKSKTWKWKYMSNLVTEVFDMFIIVNLLVVTLLSERYFLLFWVILVGEVVLWLSN